MDVTILHLSDLHITVKNNTYSEVLKNLINDVKAQCKSLKYIILVITGDIINQAIYSDENIKVVLSFFQDLKNVIGDKVINVEITPGNHDKEIDDLNRNLIENNLSIKEPTYLDSKMWQYYLVSLHKYIDLCNKIRFIFNKNSKTIKNSYYVETIDFEKFQLNFINLDTSWSALGGKNDERKLRLDIHQLEELKQQHQEAINKTSKITYTFMTAHHPLHWMAEIDETYITPWLLNSEYFNIDFYLCGHTHDRQIKSFFDTFKSYHVFVTGIGWDEKTAQDKKDQHRYSIYNLSFSNNCCEVIIRKTQANGEFDYDNDVLISKNEKESKKIHLPIKPFDNRPAIKIPIYRDNRLDYDYLFVNESIMKKIQKTFHVFYDVINHMEQFKYWQINEFFRQFQLAKQSKTTKIKREIYDSYFYQHEDVDEVAALFSKIKNEDLIFSNFISYLREFCGTVVNRLKDEFDEITCIRLHFRKYYYVSESDDELYIAFCQATSETSTPPSIRDIEYESIVKIAFENNKSFVFLHIPEYNPLDMNHSQYGNFLTMAPQSYVNIYSHKVNGKQIERPYLSASLSISTTPCESNLLDIFNYLHIGSFIFNHIEDYIRLFKINLTHFVQDGGRKK